MTLFEELDIYPLINASDTYTRIGGSRMSQTTLSAYVEAGQHFMDIEKLGTKIGERIAKLSNNEGAFVTSGAAASVILSVSACMVLDEPNSLGILPQTDSFKRNEVIIFKSQTTSPVLPYWHLIELSGAKLIKVDDELQALEDAINTKTACIFLFAGTTYEQETPDFDKVIQLAKRFNVKVIVDAAAQLPPKRNLWYYTKELGADLVIFSGGKFINGPQTTGVTLGSSSLIALFSSLSNPNVDIGRPFKVGKEEYVAFYQAFREYIALDEEKEFLRLLDILTIIKSNIKLNNRGKIRIESEGRLGQKIPLLYIDFTDQTLGVECYDYMYNDGLVKIDIGYFDSEHPAHLENSIFINAINLRAEDLRPVIDKLNSFFEIKSVGGKFK